MGPETPDDEGGTSAESGLIHDAGTRRLLVVRFRRDAQSERSSQRSTGVYIDWNFDNLAGHGHIRATGRFPMPTSSTHRGYSDLVQAVEHGTEEAAKVIAIQRADSRDNLRVCFDVAQEVDALPLHTIPIPDKDGDTQPLRDLASGVTMFWSPDSGTPITDSKFHRSDEMSLQIVSNPPAGGQHFETQFEGLRTTAESVGKLRGGTTGRVPLSDLINHPEPTDVVIVFAHGDEESVHLNDIHQDYGDLDSFVDSITKAEPKVVLIAACNSHRAARRLAEAGVPLVLGWMGTVPSDLATDTLVAVLNSMKNAESHGVDFDRFATTIAKSHTKWRNKVGEHSPEIQPCLWVPIGTNYRIQPSPTAAQNSSGMRWRKWITAVITVAAVVAIAVLGVVHLLEEHPPAGVVSGPPQSAQSEFEPIASIGNLNPNEPLGFMDNRPQSTNSISSSLVPHQDELQAVGFLGDREEAEREAEGVLAEDPANFEALILLAQAAKDPDRSWETADLAVSVATRSVDKAVARALRALATTRQENPDIDQANRDIQTALRLDDTSPIVHRIQATIQVIQRQYPQALESIDHAISLGLPPAAGHAFHAWVLLSENDESNYLQIIDHSHRAFEAGAPVGVLTNAAEAYSRSGNPGQAIATFDQILSTEDDNSGAISRRAELTAQAQGDKIAADWLQSYLNKVEGSLNDLKYPYSTLGDLLTKSGQSTEALPILDRVIEAFESDEKTDKSGLASAKLRRALAYQSEQRYDDALEDLKDSENLNPDWVEPTRVRGEILFYDLTEPDIDTAIEAFEFATQKDPSNYLAQAQLGQAYQRRGDIVQAREAYVAARSLAPTASWPLVRLATMEDDLDVALNLSREAFELNPDDSEARVLLGRYLRVNNKLPEAKEHLDQQLEIHPEDVALLTERAYLSLDESKQASNWDHRVSYLDGIEFVDRALAAETSDQTLKGELHNLRGGVLQRLERSVEAAQEFKLSIEASPDWIVPTLNLAGLALNDIDDNESVVKLIEPLLHRENLDHELGAYLGDESYAEYLYQLVGSAYLKLGRPKEAQEKFRLDLRPDFHPKSARSIVGLAVAQWMQEHRDGSTSAALDERLIERARRLDALGAVDALEFFNVEHTEVIAVLETALAEDPTNLDVYRRLNRELTPSETDPYETQVADLSRALKITRAQAQRDPENLRFYRYSEGFLLWKLARAESEDSVTSAQRLDDADTAYLEALVTPGSTPSDDRIRFHRRYFVTDSQGDTGLTRSELIDLFHKIPSGHDDLEDAAWRLSWLLTNRFGDDGTTTLLDLLRGRVADSLHIRDQLMEDLLNHAESLTESDPRTRPQILSLIDEALTLTEQANRDHPGYNWPLVLRCRAWLIIDNFAEAATACEAAFNRYGRSFQTSSSGVDLTTAASEAIAAADPSSAMKFVHIIARSQPDNPDGVAQDLISIARAFREYDMSPESLEVLAIALEQGEPVA